MPYLNEEILLCTSCHHIISSKAILSEYAYSHPILGVLLCKTCYNRITNVGESASDKLCLWCRFPGKYTTCSKCSSNFCTKCLRNNFSEDVFINITRKKTWTCFHCLPELLMEHTKKCAKILKRMRNNQSKPARSKRSNSKSPMKPLNKLNADSSNLSSSDEELSENKHNSQTLKKIINKPNSNNSNLSPSGDEDNIETDKKVPSSSDYNSVKEEILAIANQVLMLGFEINPKTLNFTNKFANQNPCLKVVKNGYTFTSQLLDGVIKIMNTWKSELKNTEDKWKQDFNISLYIPETEDAATNSEDSDNNYVENLLKCNSNGSLSDKPQKKKKYRLSLKKKISLESQYTDDGFMEDIDDTIVSPSPADETSFELNEDVNREILEVPKEVHETEQNVVAVIPETPIEKDLGDEDCDNCSISSDKTVIISFPPAELILENVKQEIGSSNELSPNQEIGTISDYDEILCETTGYFTTPPKSNISSQNTSLAGNPEIREDADSDTSFIFDINNYGSRSPPRSECNNTVSEAHEHNIDEELNTTVLNFDITEKNLNECTTESESEKQIESPNDPPVNELKDAHNSDSETHNNDEVTTILECDKTSNETKDLLEANEDGENLKHNEVTDNDKVASALNEENIVNDDDKTKDVVANNSELNPESNNDPGCSFNTKTDEPRLDNDKNLNEEDLDATINIDIRDTALIKDNISDLEVSQAKINFFDELGLYSNIAETKAHYIQEDNREEQENINKMLSEESCQNIKNVLKLLKEDDTDLFDSDSDTSISSVSDEEEETEQITCNPIQDKLGLVNMNFPLLPTETIIVASNNNVIVGNQEDMDTVRNEEQYQIKPCTVVLERLEDVLAKKDTPSGTENTELMEIERLTNLNNLGIKRKGDTTPKKTRLKKRKVIKSSGTAASDGGTTDFESDGDNASQSIPSPVMTDIINHEEGVLDTLINFAASTSDFDLDTSGMESDDEDGDKKKKEKKRKRTASTESNKENQPDNQKNDESTSKELTAEELALAEKRKWKNDPLLRTKLTESGSGTDSDATVEGENILSEKSKIKMAALEEKRKKRNTRKASRTTSRSSHCKSENETDKDESNSEIDDDVEDFKRSIVINTDTDSDIEFISEIKERKRSTKKSPNSKSVLCISSDEADEQESDGEDESAKKKKGRKNIRAILSDETLEEETKRASLMEKQRKDRLNQKQTQLDSMISQSQILSQQEGLILDVNEETQLPLIVVNSTITKRLKSHQKSGVRFMWENCYEGVKQLQNDPGSGCIIAHCMGLGKSFQVVALIHTLFAHTITKTKHVLVVCPLSVVLNWKNEFKKGLEGVNDNVNINIFCVSDRHSDKERRLFIVDKWRQQTGVLIMGYEAYEILTSLKKVKNQKRQDNVMKVLVDPGPDLVVLDEGHLLKNGKNMRTKALMKVKTKRRIILTGTPMQNNLKEYYHMVQFVKPNLLGSYVEYTNRFVNPITNGQFHDSTEEDCRRMKNRSHVLFKMLKDTVQRYEVTELESYLPPRKDYVLFIQPHIIQAQLYEKYLDLIKNDAGVVKGSLINNFHKLHVLWTHPCLLHLRQEQKKSQKKSKEVDVINLEPEINDADEFPEGWWHPLCPDDYKTNIEYGPKFKAMLAIIRECEKIGDKVLIFSSSLIELDAIESFLQQHATATSQWKPKHDYYRMDGTVVPDVRLQLCNEFNDINNTTTRVFLISNRVGGLGLNLVAANRVILMDVNWNPAYDNQSVFRTYRFGQTKQCYIYRLVSMGTMEEVVYQRQINKLAIAGRVIDEMQISRHYKSDDLQKMYRLQYDIERERPALPIPPDMVLATVIQECEEIFRYHEHQSLLENKPEEELDEDEMKLAWEEFNRENEKCNLQTEEQKKRVLAAQAAPGPSSVNPFLPSPTGPPMMNQFPNKINPFLPRTGGQPNVNQFQNKIPRFPGQFGSVYSKKTTEGAAQPGFEVVMVDENLQDNFISQPNRIQHQNATQPGKPNELRSKFYNYIKQFSQPPENVTDIQIPTASQISNNVNHTSISNAAPIMQTQNNANVVQPQIVNSSTQPQAPVTKNLGYTLPANPDMYVRKAVLPKSKKSATANTSILKKTAAEKTPSFVNVNKTYSNNTRVRQQKFPPSTSKTKTYVTVAKPINIANVVKNTVRPVHSSTNKRPPQQSKAGHRVVINDNLISEIIDVDSGITTAPIPNNANGKTKNKTTVANKNKQQELINTLHRNLDITLSVRDKPNQNDIIEISEANVNAGGDAVSISAIPRNTIQSNSNDVIEID